MAASLLGNTETIKVLLQTTNAKAMLMQKASKGDYKGQTALMIAAEWGKVEVIEALLKGVTGDAGEEILTQVAGDGEWKGANVLEFSGRSRHEKAVTLLKKLCKKFGLTEQCTKKRLASGFKATAERQPCDATCLTIFFENVSADNYSDIKSQLESKTNEARKMMLIFEDNEGLTALMAASLLGNTETIKVLLQTTNAKAMLMQKASKGDYKGQTALMIAAEWGKVEVIEALLKGVTGGAEEEILTQVAGDGEWKGANVLEFSGRSGHEKAVTLLKELCTKFGLTKQCTEKILASRFKAAAAEAAANQKRLARRFKAAAEADQKRVASGFKAAAADQKRVAKAWAVAAAREAEKQEAAREVKKQEAAAKAVAVELARVQKIKRKQAEAAADAAFICPEQPDNGRKREDFANDWGAKRPLLCIQAITNSIMIEWWEKICKDPLITNISVDNSLSKNIHVSACTDDPWDVNPSWQYRPASLTTKFIFGKYKDGVLEMKISTGTPYGRASVKEEMASWQRLRSYKHRIDANLKRDFAFATYRNQVCNYLTKVRGQSMVMTQSQDDWLNDAGACEVVEFILKSDGKNEWSLIGDLKLYKKCLACDSLSTCKGASKRSGNVSKVAAAGLVKISCAKMNKEDKEACKAHFHEWYLKRGSQLGKGPIIWEPYIDLVTYRALAHDFHSRANKWYNKFWEAVDTYCKHE